MGTFGRLAVYAASRRDLLAMKVLAHRNLDRKDIEALGFDADDIEFVRKYLLLMKVPSRGVDLDGIRSAEEYLKVLEEGLR